MKILILTQKIAEGDSLLGFFCAWLNELAERVAGIYVLTLEKRAAQLASNIKVYSCGKEAGKNRLVRFLKFNGYLGYICWHKRPDLIFVHMCPEYLIPTWFYAKIRGIPMVMWYAHGRAGWLLKISHRLAERIVTSSPTGFRVKSPKIVVSGQGIDIEKFRIQKPESGNQRKGKKIILSLGRISPIKNYETLIKAADLLVNHTNSRDLEFRIVGGVAVKSQDSYFVSLKNMVSEYKLEGYVQFTGPVSYRQIEYCYHDCDLFVSTSLTGSLDKSVLEAMSCGRVILTCNEAFIDTLGDYGKELVFAQKDHRGLAEKISTLLGRQEGLSESLSRHLRRIVVQGHSLNRWADNLTNVFLDVVKEQKGN